MDTVVDKPRRPRRRPPNTNAPRFVVSTDSAPQDASNTNAGNPSTSNRSSTRNRRNIKPKQPSTTDVPASDDQPTITDHDKDHHHPSLNANAPEFKPDTTTTNQNDTQQPKNKNRRQRQRRKPTTDQTHADHESLDNNHDHTEELPTCLLCCNPMNIVAFGECNHPVACAWCTLRLRQCYKKTNCPLCTQDLQRIVIAPYRHDLPQFSSFLEEKKAYPVTEKKVFGPGTLLIDTWAPPGSNTKTKPHIKLYRLLRNRTSTSCSICDPHGSRPFDKHNALLQHVENTHKKHLCKICLNGNRVFPLDLEVYQSEDALRNHMTAVHPRCEFCRRHFYDVDLLWNHMLHQHHKCELCQPSIGGDYPYFATIHTLRQHYEADHYACPEPECAASLVAFATAEELKRHHIQVHSSKLQRWNAAVSRPLHIDIQFVRRPGMVAVDNNNNNNSGSGSGNNRGRGGGRQQRDRRGGNNNNTTHNNNTTYQSDNYLEDDNYRIIDDDIGMMNDADFARYIASLDNTSNNNTRQRYGTTIHRGSGGAAAVTREEQFPSLLRAHNTTDNNNSNNNNTTNTNDNSNAASSSSRPPLVKHTVRCPCGQRITHYVIEQGQPIPHLDCDAVCQVEGRRARLADAFGVDNPDKHVSVFDMKKKDAVWNGMLLSAAKKNRGWVESIEREFAGFIADGQAKRHIMAPMNRAQRTIVHEMAEQYGLASVSSGHEPNRCVELYKTTTSSSSITSSSHRYGIPQRLLSKVALTVSDEEIESLLKAAEGYPVKFVDVAPTADLHYYLRRWEHDGWKLDWLSSTEAVCTFVEEKDRKELLDSFGGGIRGIFRIERGWAPKTSVATNSGSGSGSSGVAPWAKKSNDNSNNNEGGGASGGSSSSTWTAVASSSSHQQTTAAVASTDDVHEGKKEAVKSGWMVIGGGKRGGIVQPRMVGMVKNGGSSQSVASFEALNLDDGGEQ